MKTTSEIRDRKGLLGAESTGLRPSYFFFWGHRARAGVSVGKWCLSQWWPAPFVVGGDTYPTAEHFMMAEKASLFGDEAARRRILGAESPASAKKLGRGVRGFQEGKWVEERYSIVVRGNLAKFAQHPALRSFLLDTREDILVEASPTDKVWGIGLAADHPDASSPARWPGLNLLGFALMEVRSRLRYGAG